MPIHLPSCRILECLPMEILNQGTRPVAQYLLDLASRPKSRQVFRTKLMVVGFENVGKTSLLHCLFPLTGYLYLESPGIIKQKSCFWFQLQGNFLWRFPDENKTKLLEELEISSTTFTLAHLQENKGSSGQYGFSLVPKMALPLNQSGQNLLSRRPSKGLPINFYCDSAEEEKRWMERLKELTSNYATHGISIFSQEIDHPLARKMTNEKVIMSVWDFGGQHDYYNNHHYFLSTRAVFLVTWNIMDGKKGLEGLNFWFSSLRNHLPSDPLGPNSKALYSVFVIGTHVDMNPSFLNSKQERDEAIRKLAEGHGYCCEILIHEVSSKTMAGISPLMSSLLKEALSHSYMGELIPESYLFVCEALGELHEERKDLPIISLELLLSHIQETRMIDLNLNHLKRALNLLSSWGTCVYFEEPAILSSMVILDPRFLTKTILAQLFNPQLSHLIKGGILLHKDLVHFWPRCIDRAPTLMALMEKFEVCFELKQQDPSLRPRSSSRRNSRGPTLDNYSSAEEEKPFAERKSVVPPLLPQDPPLHFTEVWPSACPFECAQIERVISFNVIPREMVGRLLVNLHSYLHKDLVWRNGILLRKNDALCLVLMELEQENISVSLRSPSRTRCSEFLETVVEFVDYCASFYKNVSWVEMARSPHDRNALISLKEAEDDHQREEGHRTLICPSTGLPVKAEKLLYSSGLIPEIPELKGCFPLYFFFL